MKSIIAAGLLLGASAPAMAGPYANVENNTLWTGGDYQVSVTEVHAGYEFDNGIYVQAGPAFINVEDEGTDTEYSGQLGITREVSENVEVYAEVAFLTIDQEFDFDTMNIGTEVGVTYRF